MIMASVLFALSGCDGTTGTSSDHGIAVVAPVVVPPVVIPPVSGPDADTSRVEASLGSVEADGTAKSTITVTVKDANSNLVTNASVSLDQTGSSYISSVTDNGDGTYTFDVTSTIVEKVTYTATADGVVITQTADVDFTAVPPPVPDAGTSTVTVSPASVAANGIAKATVTVTVNDASSNPITNAAVSLAQTGSSTIGIVSNHGDGTYTVEVASTTVEMVTYTATADTITITQTADVDFTAPVPDADTSRVEASLGSVAINNTSTITVTVKDADSYLIKNASVSLAQTGTSFIGNVNNVGDGTYTFDVTDTKKDKVTYTATANGVVITQTADVNFTIAPPQVPDTVASTVTVSQPSVAADGTETATVTVTVKDVANGDPIPYAGVSLDQNGSSYISAVTNHGDGTYTFDVTSIFAETVTYTATADTVVITQTADVDFTTLPADATNSTVAVSPSSVPADGIAKATVTVTVRDVLKNRITGATVTLDDQGGSSTVSTGPVGYGTYQFYITSTTVETVKYFVNVDYAGTSVILTQEPEVTFTQPEAACLLAAGGYEAISIKGRTWLDRNLGASKYADYRGDTAAYGDYYQWGRTKDGHQVSTSATSTTLADSLSSDNTSTAWYGKFITTAFSASASDWTTVDANGNNRSDSLSNPYDAATNKNQVCPCGYVVPTQQDFAALGLSTDPAAKTAFKLALPGYRDYSTGTVTSPSTAVYFWTSDPDKAYYYDIAGETPASLNNKNEGLPIRCVKP
jgi:hypothetical protein